MLIHTHFHPDDLRGIITDILSGFRRMRRAYQHVESSYVQYFQRAQF